MSTESSILWLIRQNGYTVSSAETRDGVELVAAGKDGTRRVVRAEDEYLAACELATACGIDLE